MDPHDILYGALHTLSSSCSIFKPPLWSIYFTCSVTLEFLPLSIFTAVTLVKAIIIPTSSLIYLGKGLPSSSNATLIMSSACLKLFSDFPHPEDKGSILSKAYKGLHGRVSPTPLSYFARPFFQTLLCELSIGPITCLYVCWSPGWKNMSPSSSWCSST